MSEWHAPAHLTVDEAARRLRRSVSTIRRWIAEERLRSAQPGGRSSPHLIPVTEIERLLRGDRRVEGSNAPASAESQPARRSHAFGRGLADRRLPKWKDTA